MLFISFRNERTNRHAYDLVDVAKVVRRHVIFVSYGSASDKHETKKK